MYHMT